MSFEAAGRRIGALSVNFIRLLFALVFLTAYSAIFRGPLIPLDASGHAWLWLALSGIVGFVMGDLCLFRSFILVGGRVAMVVFSLVPPMTALFGWAVLGEVLSARAWMGMMVTVGGISLVVLTRDKGDGKVRLSHPLAGIVLALLGAVGQAAGLVLSKHGMGDFDPFASTQIRILAAAVAFLFIVPIAGLGHRIRSGFRNVGALRFVLLGAFFGPFLGVSLSLLAIKHIQTGVASTIMALVPVFAIAPEVFILKRRVRPAEILGAFVAVGGVALLSL
jgi:drug/metabolite transporter (DMT)-like permease